MKKVLITGSGRGIGHSTAQLFLNKGYEVYAVSRSLQHVDDYEKGKQEKLHLIEADLVTFKGQDVLVDHLEKFGYPDIVVANMQHQHKYKPLVAVKAEEYHQNNTNSSLYLMKILAKTIVHQKSKKFGRWIGISSESAKGANPGQFLYNIEKSNLTILLKQIAIEYGHHMITANTISPGLIETAGLAERISAEKVSELSQFNTIKRGGTVDEVASSIFFLATVQASFINGIELPVNGGGHLAWQLKK